MPTAFSPSVAWPCRFPCDVSTLSPTVTAAAVAFASDTLYSLTGRQFGLTAVTFRPTSQWTSDTPYPDGWMPWPGMQAPPLGASGDGWSYSPGGYGWALGTCDSSYDYRLPVPAYVIVNVKIDGTPLVSGTYRLDNQRILTRTDGNTWPRSNKMTLDDSQVGTWSITGVFGNPPPDGASLVVGALACEYIRGFNGEDCRLPRNITSVVRQGVSISMPNPLEVFKDRMTGIPIVDAFIQTWNPARLRQRARTYSIDRTPARVPNVQNASVPNYVIGARLYLIDNGDGTQELVYQ